MSNIVAGLLITLIGMGLVFLSLALLWGLMILMVKVTNRFFPDREEEGAGEDVDTGEEPVDANGEADRRAEAAAAAVAVSLSIGPRSNTTHGTMAISIESPEAAIAAALAAGVQSLTTSSWQAVHRANRLTQRLNLFSRKSGRN